VAKNLDELIAFRLAREFKLEVYRLIRTHPAAERDFRYCSQLRDSASGAEANIAEGWRRCRPREMAQYVRIGLASLEEAKVRLQDGIDRGHFTESECQVAFETARRAGAATMGLLKALQRSN
jgi:four helix bundle protein